LNGKEHKPMGSYCLVVRRSIWQQEGLSFKQVAQPSPNPKSWRGQYDTADYANVELIRRGYKVVVAPDWLADEHLVVFKGISNHTLRMQADPNAQIITHLESKDSQYLKNLVYVIKVNQGLTRLAREKGIISQYASLVSDAILNCYENEISLILNKTDFEEVDSRVSPLLNKINQGMKI